MSDREKIRIPQHEAIPAWYRLRLKNRHTLVITIHKSAMEYVQSMDYSKMPIVRGMAERFGLETFIPPTESSWGFGRMTLWGPEDVLEKSKTSRDGLWTSWQCTLPILREDSDHIKFIYFRATLSVIFKLLEIYGFEGDTKWKTPQLMIVSSMCLEPDLHGGSLHATLTPAMMKYLHAQPDESDLSEVARAMMRASHHMLGRSEEYDDTRGYRAHCRQPKWINLTVPGNACGLDPGEYRNESLNTGYELHPHNVDSSFQQLSFLMGLAKLHQLAENETS